MMISIRKIPSTRCVLLFAGFALVLWSTITGAFPKPNLLSSCLRMDSNQTSVTMNRSLEAFNDVSKPVLNSTSKLSFPTDLNAGQLGIGIPQAHLYLISLPDRQDRREHMEFLRASLGLTWTIVDATPRTATLVNRILDWVVFERAQDSRTLAEKTVFRWPKKINALSHSKEPLRPGGADTWADQSPPNQASSNQLGSDSTSLAYPATPLNLSCAVDDDRIPILKHNPPEWTILTPAKVACWHSHVSAIRQFVDGNGSDVAVILEDDIDMEKDISRRLSEAWTSLPPGWDIVFLGHCWSKESTYPALTDVDGTHLRPSFKPKCTHAYALSRSGARRLLQHLRFPPFAYSRALDQAYAWLVQSERLRSYSIVPSVVVQRKSDNSDILPGSGSEWREGLRDGVFGA